MLKLLSIICLWLLISCNAFASIEIVQSYIELHGPKDISLSKQEIEQITWVVDNTSRSHEQDYKSNPRVPHIEIDRVLTRLYCLDLLLNPNYTNYLKFVRPQLDTEIPRPLTYSGYLEITKALHGFSADDYAVLRKSIILTAVSLSKPSLINAHNAELLNTNDNLQFLARCLRTDPELFPILKKFEQEQINLKKIFYTIFPLNTNFRHMLYTEGGEDMFINLREMIKHGYFTQAELRLWYAYWVINIAGFRGHINHNGSLYLNEPVCQAMQVLYSEINKMLQTPNYQPIYAYLEYRAMLAGFANLPEQQKYTMAHLASLMRIYDQENGRKLYQAFVKLPNTQRKQFEQNCQQILQGKSNIYITHLPAVFGNALSHAQGDYRIVLATVLPMYNQLLTQCKQQHAPNLPQRRLSLNLLSAEANVHQLMRQTKYLLIVKANGDVVFG